MSVQKNSPVLIPALLVKKAEADIRDMPGATWRDVVAAVLEPCTEPVTLSFLYGKIGSYKKAQANRWWKEKVRQTLLVYPAHFAHDGRGRWSLKRRTA